MNDDRESNKILKMKKKKKKNITERKRIEQENIRGREENKFGGDRIWEA